LDAALWLGGAVRWALPLVILAVLRAPAGSQPRVLGPHTAGSFTVVPNSAAVREHRRPLRLHRLDRLVRPARLRSVGSTARAGSRCRRRCSPIRASAASAFVSCAPPTQPPGRESAHSARRVGGRGEQSPAPASLVAHTLSVRRCGNDRSSLRSNPPTHSCCRARRRPYAVPA